MRAKMDFEENRALYSLRKQTEEPVFGTVKGAMDFRLFWLTGLCKVEGGWALVLLAYKCWRLTGLLQGPIQNGGRPAPTQGGGSPEIRQQWSGRSGRERGSAELEGRSGYLCQIHSQTNHRMVQVRRLLAHRVPVVAPD